MSYNGQCSGPQLKEVFKIYFTQYKMSNMIIMVWRLIGSAFEVLGAAPDLAFPTWGGHEKML